MMSAKSPDPIDKYVGSRVRMRRIALGMSQTQLANQVGVTFQQIQKYEKGTNRVSASRLQQFCEALDVPVHFFFEGAPKSNRLPRRREGRPEPTYVTDFLVQREGHGIMKSFARIQDSTLRRSIVHVIEAIADTEDRK